MYLNVGSDTAATMLRGLTDTACVTSLVLSQDKRNTHLQSLGKHSKTVKHDQNQQPSVEPSILVQAAHSLITFGNSVLSW